ncbi:MAG: BMP family ABC transporter substrate-binding protein [Ruminococcaceae bacterium]|nr:BMP family ABC transporter substrate-binding protein [Oscillospiraceae bacterium]
MIRQEATEHYLEALRTGRRTYKERMLIGEYPYPQVLDEILDDTYSAGQIDMGLLEIPAERIVGTRTRGRRDAFAADFMPLLDKDTEFAAKWIALCEAHLSDEGIRDAVRCFEYLGRFYVQEGNKRVSVLKSYGAASIPAHVTRIIPAWSDDPEIRAYYDFMRAYQLARLYQVQFSREGSFSKLQAALGYESEHVWTDEERRSFLAGYWRFESAFLKLGGARLALNVADALLVWLKVYSFEQLKSMSAAELGKALGAIWADVRVSAQDEPVAVSTEEQETEAGSGGVLSRFVQSVFPTHLSIAFVSNHLPSESGWTKAHDLGRQYIEATLSGRVTCRTYYGAQNADSTMEQAVADGAQIIFAVTPSLIGACRKVAAAHPDVRVLSCSIMMPYTGVRTYYSRIYEGKFITGAIAGAMCKSGKIGYVASNPIFGVPASINAFALGVQMTNPEARIRLGWSCAESDPMGRLAYEGAEVISNRDVPTPDRMGEPWGLCQVWDGSYYSIASPYWHWGKVYEKIVRSILSGAWDMADAGDNRAVNYCWGMRSGAIGVIIEDRLPVGVRQLAELLHRGVTDGSIDPFARPIRSQDGTLRSDGTHYFSPEEIMRMDWLADNVDGGFPAYGDLLPMARPIVRLQGVYRDTIPPESREEIL